MAHSKNICTNLAIVAESRWKNQNSCVVLCSLPEEDERFDPEGPAAVRILRFLYANWNYGRPSFKNFANNRANYDLWQGEGKKRKKLNDNWNKCKKRLARYLDTGLRSKYSTT